MIDVKEITNGSIDGKIVWVYDFRYNNFDEKPIRKVLPQSVFVQSNDKIKKKIYYSKSHFVGRNKHGDPLKSKIIALYDNTGYRSFPGTPLNVFETERECFAHFKESVYGMIAELNAYRQSKINNIDNMIKDIMLYIQTVL